MIIGNGPVITNDPAAPFVDNGAILVRDNVIEAIGTVSELRAAYPHEPFHDVAGRVIMPGLINAHTHAYSHYARGMAVSNPTRDFQEILENLWWRLDRMLTLEDVELNTTTTFVESIRNGVTTVFDHHSSPGAVEGSLFRQAEVARALGIRASLCYETSDRDGEEVFAQAAALNGKEVLLRAKVVKYNGGIMGKNWLHVQDGSGAAGTNDLTVTTSAPAELGQVLLIKGTLATGKDFGAGYKYAVLIEDATLTQ